MPKVGNVEPAAVVVAVTDDDEAEKLKTEDGCVVGAVVTDDDMDEAEKLKTDDVGAVVTGGPAEKKPGLA